MRASAGQTSGGEAGSPGVLAYRSSVRTPNATAGIHTIMTRYTAARFLKASPSVAVRLTKIQQECACEVPLKKKEPKIDIATHRSWPNYRRRFKLSEVKRDLEPNCQRKALRFNVRHPL
jgi:hypothetical protein